MPRGRGYVNRAQRRFNRAQARARGRGGLGGRRGGRGRGRGGLGGPAPMPWDSQAQRESGALGNEAADTRASLGARFGAAQRELGFGTGKDNPYSARAGNKATYTANKRGITNTAGNQLYAGSTINKQSAARSAYDKRQKQLEDSFAEAQSAYNRGVARTSRDEALGRAAIKEGAIGRAAASAPQPLGVGRGRGRRRRGRITGPRNVRRPQQARQLNRRARRINARLNRGRGRI